MKKAPEKSLLDKFKGYWEQGKNIAQADPRIGFNIKTYAVNQVFAAFQKNSALLKENEKKEFEQWIKELAVEKKALGSDHVVAPEEFEKFLENMFFNVDDEDRNGEVTMKTSASFKLLGELIDVMSQWGSLSEGWNKKSKNILLNLEKYCKFKALDIFKCLKAGQAPKRGGPKEEEDDVSKELNIMIEKGNNQPEEQTQPKFNQIPTNTNVNLESHPQINSNNNTNTKINTNAFQTTNYFEPNNNNFDVNRNTATSIDLKKENQSEPTGQIGWSKKNINSSMLAADYKIDTKIAKKLDYKLPVKYKGIEYFRLCDNIKKQLDTAQREMLGNKTDKALVHLELAYYYLTNIEK